MVYCIECVPIGVILYHILGSSVSCVCVPSLTFFWGVPLFVSLCERQKGAPFSHMAPPSPQLGGRKFGKLCFLVGRKKNGGDQERKGTAHLQIRSLPLFFFLPPKKKKKGKIATRKKLRKSAPSFDASFLWEATLAPFFSFVL